MNYYDRADIIHIVVRGDTLWSLDNRFNTTVDELRKINN
jgi:LysM repeat protein